MSNNSLAVAKPSKFTIQQLYKNPELQLDRDKMVTLLNQDPPKDWVKEHPFIKGHKYIPIEKVEFMLKKFFKKYRIEVIEYKQILNSISCSVRVHYFDPIDEEMTWHDGVGACELQTAKDSGNLKLDASNINKGAVPMALGIAKSIAVKDACDHIGNIFGANVNRKDVMAMKPDDTLATIVYSKEHERMVKLIENATSLDQLEQLREHLTEALTAQFETKWNLLTNK